MKNLLSIIVLFVSAQLWAAEPTTTWKEFTKTIEQEFPITADGLTKIQNEWGKVTVDTWKEDKVKFIVHFSIQSPNAKKGQKVLDHLSVDFSNEVDMVSAKTKVLTPKKINWYSRRNLNVAIDYQVFIPEKNQLDIQHHHGDVNLGTIMGAASINLKSGNIKGQRLASKAKIQLVHGEINLQQVGDLALTLNLSAFAAQKVDHLTLDIKHSKVKVDQLGTLEGKSVFDKLALGTVKSFAINAHYDTVRIASVEDVVVDGLNSFFEVGQLGRSVSLDMELGKFVSNMSADFDQVNVKGKHTHFSFNVPAESTFKMDVAARHGQLHYPDDFKPQYSVKTNVNKELTGVFGEGTNEGLLKARYSNGSLSITKS